MAAKLVNAFMIFGPVGNSIKVIKKYTNSGQNLDENLMSQLCLPSIDCLKSPLQPKFQTFLVTKEDGRMLYGAGLIVYQKSKENDQDLYHSYCYTIITKAPYIHATRLLLQLIWERKCDDLVIRCVMNVPLPSKRNFLRIILPPTQTTCRLGDVYLYRGMSELTLFDYSFREVFSIIPVEDFLLAFACILMEHRTLIIGQDNYQLMMISEALTAILQPLKWCNVYVPILPPFNGATYLDAPTSYIMGLNTLVTELPSDLNHVQCLIYCDEGRVVCHVDSLGLPSFFDDLASQIKQAFRKFNSNNKPKPNYLDDLKFNQAIRVIFMKIISKNILKNYERFIVDISNSQAFDVVSYLSDQPDYLRPFLSRFLETQLFASFIDESARRIQQYKNSSQLSLRIFDAMDDLSERHLNQSIQSAFESATRIHLMDLREGNVEELEIRTAPATPMKLRRKVPLASLGGHMSMDASSKTATIINPNSRILELIEEVKNKTKNILVNKINLVEGNELELIGSLCDLIERIWAHGAFSVANQDTSSFSPLWSHLLLFRRLKYLDTKPSRDGSHLNILSPLRIELDTRVHSRFVNVFDRFRLTRPVDKAARMLFNDISDIEKLADVKTDVGRARAFLTLSLERKCLSKHIETLLSDLALLNSLYKTYAFLRCEDEREKFLMYLWTLNAVELRCFTSTFVSVIETRKLGTRQQ